MQMQRAMCLLVRNIEAVLCMAAVQMSTGSAVRLEAVSMRV